MIEQFSQKHQSGEFLIRIILLLIAILQRNLEFTKKFFES